MSEETQRPTLKEKLQAAKTDYRKWTTVAANPSLSAGAANAADQISRSAYAEIILDRKIKMKFGSWEGHPALWSSREAYAFIAGRWTRVDLPALAKSVRELTTATFEKRFPKLLAEDICEDERSKNYKGELHPEYTLPRGDRLRQMARMGLAFSAGMNKQALTPQSVAASNELGRVSRPAVDQQHAPIAVKSPQQASAMPLPQYPTNLDGNEILGLVIQTRELMRLRAEQEQSKQRSCDSSQVQSESLPLSKPDESRSERPPTPTSKHLWAAIDARFQSFGQGISSLCLALIALAVAFGTPLVGILTSFYIGMWLASYVGNGLLAMCVFFGAPFFILMFLSIYVWTPHLWPALERAIDVLRIGKD